MGLQLLLDGVLNYLPCPIEASNYALDQYKREEKVRRLLGRHNERAYCDVDWTSDIDSTRSPFGAFLCLGPNISFKALATSKVVSLLHELQFPISTPIIYCDAHITFALSLVLTRNLTLHTLVASAFTLKKYSGHMTYLRIYEGVLRKGDFITDVDTSRKFEVRGLFGLYNDEVILEAHVGEMVGVIHSEPDNFKYTNGLRRYTTTSINVSESFSKDSGVQEKVNSQQNARV
uniref:Translation factor n=1 Tax=Medicago truncatula TaxID=3880 RepID=A2Q1J5_MEDTR|nr:Translation factor [Medicago truncatula]